ATHIVGHFMSLLKSQKVNILAYPEGLCHLFQLALFSSRPNDIQGEILPLTCEVLNAQQQAISALPRYQIAHKQNLLFSVLATFPGSLRFFAEIGSVYRIYRNAYVLGRGTQVYQVVPCKGAVCHEAAGMLHQQLPVQPAQPIFTGLSWNGSGPDDIR